MSKKKKKAVVPVTRKGWILRWQRTLRVVKDRLTDLLNDRDLYLGWRKVIEANPDLDPANPFFDLIHRHYWANLLVGIRSLDDHNKRSHSLLVLMMEIRDQVPLLTKKWFIDRYKKMSIGEYQFTHSWSGKTHISERRVENDINRLEKLCSKVRTLTNKVVAHNDRKRPKKYPTYGEASSVLDGLLDLVSRYNGLIHVSTWGHPVDMTRDDTIFDRPWRVQGSGSVPISSPNETETR